MVMSVANRKEGREVLQRRAVRVSRDGIEERDLEGIAELVRTFRFGTIACALRHGETAGVFSEHDKRQLFTVLSDVCPRDPGAGTVGGREDSQCPGASSGAVGDIGQSGLSQD